MLINSFVGYWQAAGLVGTAGEEQGISPLGVAIYVCLLYLMKDEELPKSFPEIFDKYSSGLKNNDSTQLQEFLLSINEFRRSIKDLEWLYLKQLQVSEDERTIPNFSEIYFAITDLNWGALTTLMTDFDNLRDLIRRLEIRVREGDSVARGHFVRWVLSLISEEKIKTNELPVTLRKYINHSICEPSSDWRSLVDEGLAEYIIQNNVAYENIF